LIVAEKMKNNIEIVETINDNFTNQLASLYENVWFTQNRKKEDIKTMLSHSYLTLGFVKSDELIGFCRVISDGIFKAFLFDVIVKEEYQNKGIGRIIIETTVNHKKLINIKHIELYCPDRITPFYKKLGFDTRTALLMRYEKE
jgi:GNAT superfamily N-acetyltransferase